jgi:hypothetical protein
MPRTAHYGPGEAVTAVRDALDAARAARAAQEAATAAQEVAGEQLALELG